MAGKNAENYYLLLDIKRNATLEEIEVAYAKMALKHHPDVAGDSPEVQKRFARINKAYSVLSKADKRADYDKLLGDPDFEWQEDVITAEQGSVSPDAGKDEPQQEARPAGKTVRKEKQTSGPGSRMSRKRLERVMINSKKLISKGDFWRADALLKQAVLAFPRDPEIRRLLARASEGRGRLREAVEDLKAAVEIEYFNPLNHTLIGNLYIKAGQLERASKSFYDALSWQEDYSPALNGLKNIQELRKKALPWWKRLLGKKK
ncbi:hypothetical protein CSA37_02870 [Candidatus Fermentibacteria bacterium]|nr:MAG: hypothetical protein CSA37_02870 [Candidatus Fermentibacteria bacterium]